MTLKNLPAKDLLDISTTSYLLLVILNWDEEGVFITMVSSISLSAIIFVISFKQGKWKSTKS